MTSYCYPRHPYLGKDSLVFQFILAEFLIVYPYIIELQARVDANSPLKKTLEELGGGSLRAGKNPIWSFTGGCLVKLNNYCLQLLQVAEENESFGKMHRHADQAVIYCMQGMKELSEGEKELSTNKILGEMSSFSHQLFAAVGYYRENENILFFLLHYAAKFDAIKYKGFTAQLLTEISHQPLPVLKENIVKAYKKRGFLHLIPLLQQLFTNLPDTLEKR